MSSYGVPIFNPDVPLGCFVRFKFGSYMYESETPNFIQGLTLNKLAGGRGEFSLTITDIMDYELEAKIIDAIYERKANISFQYGYYNGEVSNWYKGMMLNYTTEFLKNMNAVFTITGIVDNTLGKVLNRKFNMKDFGYRYSELIRHVAISEGWKIGSPFILSDVVTNEEESVTNLDTLNFIKRVIPKTYKDGTGTRFIHSSKVDGVTIMLDVIGNRSKLTKDEFSFVVNSGNYGRVLSFSPSYDAWVNISSRIEAGYVDRVTNQFTLFRNNPKLGKDDPTVTQYLGATNIEDFNHILQNNWENTKLARAATATLELVGTPSIEPLEYINILPIRPDGRLHHSAGTYYVTGVTEDVSFGYRTTLTLSKMTNVKAAINDAYTSGGWG